MMADTHNPAPAIAHDPDKVRQHIDIEPMGEQRRPGTAAQPCGGKHFEGRPALLRAGVCRRQLGLPT
jgi:hypothetical protein